MACDDVRTIRAIDLHSVSLTRDGPGVAGRITFLDEDEDDAEG